MKLLTTCLVLLLASSAASAACDPNAIWVGTITASSNTFVIPFGCKVVIRNKIVKGGTCDSGMIKFIGGTLATGPGCTLRGKLRLRINGVVGEIGLINAWVRSRSLSGDGIDVEFGDVNYAINLNR